MINHDYDHWKCLWGWWHERTYFPLNFKTSRSNDKALRFSFDDVQDLLRHHKNTNKHDLLSQRSAPGHLMLTHEVINKGKLPLHQKSQSSEAELYLKICTRCAYDVYKLYVCILPMYNWLRKEINAPHCRQVWTSKMTWGVPKQVRRQASNTLPVLNNESCLISFI